MGVSPFLFSYTEYHRFAKMVAFFSKLRRKCVRTLNFALTDAAAACTHAKSVVNWGHGRKQIEQSNRRIVRGRRPRHGLANRSAYRCDRCKGDRRMGRPALEAVSRAESRPAAHDRCVGRVCVCAAAVYHRAVRRRVGLPQGERRARGCHGKRRGRRTDCARHARSGRSVVRSRISVDRSRTGAARSAVRTRSTGGSGR